jgi:hypothetical protein
MIAALVRLVSGRILLPRAFVHFSHELNLFRSFIQVVLIDAECIVPVEGTQQVVCPGRSSGPRLRASTPFAQNKPGELASRIPSSVILHPRQ